MIVVVATKNECNNSTVAVLSQFATTFRSPIEITRPYTMRLPDWRPLFALSLRGPPSALFCYSLLPNHLLFRGTCKWQNLDPSIGCCDKSNS